MRRDYFYRWNIYFYVNPGAKCRGPHDDRPFLLRSVYTRLTLTRLHDRFVTDQTTARMYPAARGAFLLARPYIYSIDIFWILCLNFPLKLISFPMMRSVKRTWKSLACVFVVQAQVWKSTCWGFLNCVCACVCVCYFSSFHVSCLLSCVAVHYNCNTAFVAAAVGNGVVPEDVSETYKWFRDEMLISNRRLTMRLLLLILQRLSIVFLELLFLTIIEWLYLPVGNVLIFSFLLE